MFSGWARRKAPSFASEPDVASCKSYTFAQKLFVTKLKPVFFCKLLAYYYDYYLLPSEQNTGKLIFWRKFEACDYLPNLGLCLSTGGIVEPLNMKLHCWCMSWQRRCQLDTKQRSLVASPREMFYFRLLNMTPFKYEISKIEYKMDNSTIDDHSKEEP